MGNALASTCTMGRIANIALKKFITSAVTKEIDVGGQPCGEVVEHTYMLCTIIEQVFYNMRTDETRATRNEEALTSQVLLCQPYIFT